VDESPVIRFTGAVRVLSLRTAFKAVRNDCLVGCSSFSTGDSFYHVTNGNKLLSLKPVVRTRRSYNRAGLIKQQKSFQGLAMYGHEVFDVLTKASTVIRDTLFD
jgi:hypothetical protein